MLHLRAPRLAALEADVVARRRRALAADRAVPALAEAAMRRLGAPVLTERDRRVVRLGTLAQARELAARLREQAEGESQHAGGHRAQRQ